MSLADTALSLESQADEWDRGIDAGTVTIGGTNYSGSVTCDRIRRVETTQGWQQQQTIYVRVRKSLLATQPALGAKLTFSGQVYDVEDVGGTKSDEIAWTFTCRRWIKR